MGLWCVCIFFIEIVVPQMTIDLDKHRFIVVQNVLISLYTLIFCMVFEGF